MRILLRTDALLLLCLAFTQAALAGSVSVAAAANLVYVL